MSDAAVTASVVAAIVSGAGAFIAWIKEAALARNKAAAESQLAGFKGLLDNETEKLRAHLQAGLVSHEVLERQRADLRLKILMMDEERVTHQFTAFRECLALSNRVCILLADGKTVAEGLSLTTELSSKLAGSHSLLPSELVEPAAAVERAFRNLAGTSNEGTISKLGTLNGEALDRLDQFEKAARVWRDKARKALLDRPGTV